MTEFFRSRPFVLLALLCIFNLFLLSVQVRSDDGRLLIRTWGLVLLTPAAFAADVVSGAASRLGGRYRYLRQVEERNRYLEEENWRLQSELHQLRALEERVERDELLRELAAGVLFDVRRASVIWRNLPPYSRRIVIDAGSRQGVEKDAAVVRPEGAVGRILAVTPVSAEVELLIDSSAAAAALIRETRIQGVVQGTGREELVLNFIPVTEPVEEGQVVVTAGTDGIYPKGLPLGVVRVVRSGGGVYHRIFVIPAVSFSTIEDVAVVVDES